MTGIDLTIARPGDAGYEAAAAVFNLAAPATPAAAVTARTIEDIRAAIGYARVEGLGVRVHTTGHSAGSARPMHDSVLIRTELAGHVEIDAARRVARVPAGTRWGDVVEAASPHGLVAPHGSSPTVGVVGFLLRGGMSFYSRKIGVAANSVRAIELVTADGDLRRVDAAHDPELFRALRGGGGGFGVVTAVEFDLFPATRVVTGAAFWPAAHAFDLLRLWRRWTEDAPEAAATTFRVLNLPSLPEIPAELTSGPVVCLAGVVLSENDEGDDAVRHADDLLAPLRAVASPVMDTWELSVPEAVLEAHMDPAEPAAILGDHMLLGEIGDEGAAEFLRVVGPGSGSPLVAAELRQLGGAAARPSPAGGVLDHFDARFAYMAAGLPDLQAPAQSIVDHCSLVRVALGPWDTGRTAPTFVESLHQPQGHLGPQQVRFVDQVRARVDPAGLLRGDISPNA